MNETIIKYSNSEKNINVTNIVKIIKNYTLNEYRYNEKNLKKKVKDN